MVIGFHLHAIDVPSHGGKRVVDTASILSATEVVDLESRLKNYERATSNQVVVLTVDSLQGETIETFAHEVFQSWKLGQKGVDNGVLILISVGEKNTARIEVGYGLEGVLPDITAGRIISHEMRPEFKQKHYHASILAGITAIQQAIGGTYVVPEGTEETETDPTFVFFWIVIIVAAVITCWICSASFRGTDRCGGRFRAPMAYSKFTRISYNSSDYRIHHWYRSSSLVRKWWRWQWLERWWME